MLTANAFILFAYLMGSISSAVIVSRLMNLPDPRTQGSGNPGTTNVLRVGGKFAAALTLLGDMLKAVIPILFAKAIGLPEHIIGFVALAAFLGHLFPVFFRFKGGKGVATYFGVIIALAWPVGLLAVATWVLVAFLFRYSSLAALLMALATPLYLYPFGQAVYALPLMIMSIILIIKHHENIKRLLKGNESKLGKR